MKREIADLKSNDLILYITKVNAIKSEKNIAFPSPIINVLGSVNDWLGNPQLEFLCNGYTLLPETVIVGGKSRARVMQQQFNYVQWRSCIELRCGKNDVLEYIGSRPDLTLHSEWISNLGMPYADNFPKAEKIIVI